MNESIKPGALEKANFSLVKLALCGPSDVDKEIRIAKEIINNWNINHGETRGFWVEHSHWRTDVYPDLASRTQDVPNRQIIDPAKIIVAILWSRFGTPTGIAESGTKEEILRAASQGKKVMVYFSDLEPKPSDADSNQLESLWKFRQEIRQRGICFTFQSRSEFQKMFANHLIHALNSFEAAPLAPKPTRQTSTISQKANTKKGNVYQFVDNSTVYNNPPKTKIIRERRSGSVTVQEEKQIADWIYDLAEGEVGMSRPRAYKKWGGLFKIRFGLMHRADLLSSQIPEAEAWYNQQKAIQKSGYRTKAPDAYVTERITSIKAAMNEMGRNKSDYYPELSARLKMRRPFKSLKDLTIKNLGRVYSAVRSDLKKWKSSGF